MQREMARLVCFATLRPSRIMRRGRSGYRELTSDAAMAAPASIPIPSVMVFISSPSFPESTFIMEFGEEKHTLFFS